jgi:hypothetical protein
MFNSIKTQENRFFNRKKAVFMMSMVIHPEIPGTQETKGRRMPVQNKPGAKSETLPKKQTKGLGTLFK